MTDNEKILNFDEALNILNEASQTFKIDVWIPSLNKEVSFKGIDAKQQKSLLSAAIDDSVYNSDFVKCFYNILKDNILDKDVSVDDLTLVDRSFIAISLKNQISNQLTVKFSDSVVEDVNLNDIIEKFKTYENSTDISTNISNDNTSLIVDLGLPIIKDEVSYEENFYKNYKKVEDLKTTKDIQIVISEAFIGEISKYIKTLHVNDNKFYFRDLTINQRLRIVEKLPSELIQKIIDKISSEKKKLDSILEITSKDGIKKIITIDSILFLS